MKTKISKRLTVVIIAVLIISQSWGQKERIQIGPNVMVSCDHPQDGKQRELNIAAHPTNPMILLGSGIRIPVYNQKIDQEPRAYYSHDGGYSWNTILYPEASIQRLGDPVVGFGRTGTAYFVAMGLDANKESAVLFYRSEEGGFVWNKPLYLPFMDHEQIVVDNTNSQFAGNIYLSGVYGPCGQEAKFHGTDDYHIGVLHSSDDGKTWALTDAVNNHDMVDGRGLQSSMSPIVFADGELLVPIHSWRNLPPNATSAETQKFYEDPEDYQYLFTSSKDGGNTFSSLHKLVFEDGGEITGQIVPSYAVDNSNRQFKNRVYIVWSEKNYYPWQKDQSGKSRILLSYSSNRGKTWSKPKMVSPAVDGIGNQFMPTIAVNNEGVLAIAWYDTRDTKENLLVNQYLTASMDGGETFLPAVRVSSEATDYDNLKKNIVGIGGDRKLFSLISAVAPYGDYFGMATSSDGTFHPIWLDGRTGLHQIWTANVVVAHAEKANDKKPNPALIETDVSDQVEVISNPMRQFTPTGTLAFPIRLKNKSDKPIYGPITLEITSLAADGAAPLILNANNKSEGVGAIFDYTRALGDFESLLPGKISEEVIWRFKISPLNDNLPYLTFKVTARVEKETR